MQAVLGYQMAGMCASLNSNSHLWTVESVHRYIPYTTSRVTTFNTAAMGAKEGVGQGLGIVSVSNTLILKTTFVPFIYLFPTQFERKFHRS